MAELLGDLEQKIMKVIWESDNPLKPSEVLTRLDEGYAYTTVMTVLKRLHDKGLLNRVKKGKAYLYQSTEKKENFAKKRLKKLFSSILGTYNELAITQFVDSLENNPEDIQKLKKYLNEIEQRNSA